jgi:hypothetical protein
MINQYPVRLSGAPCDLALRLAPVEAGKAREIAILKTI